MAPEVLGNTAVEFMTRMRHQSQAFRVIAFLMARRLGSSEMSFKSTWKQILLSDTTPERIWSAKHFDQRGLAE